MLQSISSYFSPQSKKEAPSVIRLPPHYPQILHYYNDKLAKISYLNDSSKTLGVSPIIVVLSGITIFSLILFGPYIMNTVIVCLLLTSLGLQSLMLNQQNSTTSEQYFITISSLILFSVYTLIYPFLDFVLDWIPFYYFIKFGLVLALIYQVESEGSNDDKTSNDESPFRMDSLPHPYPIVTLVIRAARTSFELIYAYTTHYIRLGLWRFRTKALEWAKVYDYDTAPTPTPKANQGNIAENNLSLSQHAQDDDSDAISPPTLTLTDSEMYEMIDDADFTDLMNEVNTLALPTSPISADISTNNDTSFPTTITHQSSSYLSDNNHNISDEPSVPTLDDVLYESEEHFDLPKNDHNHGDNIKTGDLTCPAYVNLYSNQSLEDTVHDNYYSKIATEVSSSTHNHDIKNPYDDSNSNTDMLPVIANTISSPRDSSRSDGWCVLDGSLSKSDQN